MRKSTKSKWEKSPGLLDETYEQDSALVPELPVVGLVKLSHAIPGSLRHDRHPGEYELHLILRGRLHFFVEAQRFEVGPGMVFLTWPGELHWGEDMMLSPGLWYRLRFRLDLNAPLPQIGNTKWDETVAGMRDLPSRIFPALDPLKNCLARILEEHRHPDGHSEIALKALYIDFLVNLLRSVPNADALNVSRKSEASTTIKRALEYLDQHIAETFSIEEAALHAGLSPRQFRARFRAETGFSPVEFVERRRVENAMLKLAVPGVSIKEIAHNLGFANSSYFAAIFKRFTGISPVQFRVRCARK